MSEAAASLGITFLRSGRRHAEISLACRLFVMTLIGTRVLVLPRSTSHKFVSLRTVLKSTNRRFSASTMSRDTTLQSDIGKANSVDKDGSFKRLDASFRSHVSKGSEFAPEKGTMDSEDI